MFKSFEMKQQNMATAKAYRFDMLNEVRPNYAISLGYLWNSFDCTTGHLEPNVGRFKVHIG